jgi:hypothetical protein
MLLPVSFEFHEQLRLPLAFFSPAIYIPQNTTPSVFQVFLKHQHAVQDCHRDANQKDYHKELRKDSEEEGGKAYYDAMLDIRRRTLQTPHVGHLRACLTM